MKGIYSFTEDRKYGDTYLVFSDDPDEAKEIFFKHTFGKTCYYDEDGSYLFVEGLCFIVKAHPIVNSVVEL